MVHIKYILGKTLHKFQNIEQKCDFSSIFHKLPEISLRMLTRTCEDNKLTTRLPTQPHEQRTVFNNCDFRQTLLGQLNTHVRKNETGGLPHTTDKNRHNISETQAQELKLTFKKTHMQISMIWNRQWFLSTT